MSQKKLIGRVETISILDLDIYDLDAKIDTGAYSSSLHCDDILIDKNNYVSFKLHDKIHPSYHGKSMKLPLYKMKRVKSSNGEVEKRPSIKVKVDFFGNMHNIVLSLTNRENMKYPMLIGRKFLTQRFIVDVSQKYLSKKLNEEK